jgi:uncharacterized BrkB/YihY/UPF0761 family membrane protein
VNGVTAGQETSELERPRLARRERIVRVLTFWLRPDFVLRVIGRFQKIAGFDRAIALASSALTAVIPLTIVASAIATKFGGQSTADRIIARYDLTGGGAEAVKDALSPPSGTSTSLGAVGFLFLLIAVLSFTRTVQRLFETTWELKPLSVRNSVNGLAWTGLLTVYAGATGVIHGIFGDGNLELTAAVIDIPVSVVFLMYTGWMLSAKRISRTDLLPFAIAGSVLLAIYSVGASVYLPHLFSTYATRYGVIGAVFAMISAFFCVMVVLVGSAAVGREIHDELGRIRRGERPAEDEVKRQWDDITTEARSRWDTAQAWWQERRDRGEED